MVDQLDDFEEMRMDEQYQKLNAYMVKKQAKAAQERQGQLMKEAYGDAAKELGMSVEEFSKMMGEPDPADSLPDIESHFKEKVKGYWIERAGMKKAGPGRMQNARGQFTSPRKETERKQVASTLDSIRERVRSGGRVSEDELAAIVNKVIPR